MRFIASAYQAIKHKIEAVKRREPNPPKTYVNHLDEASNISVPVVVSSEVSSGLLFEQVSRRRAELVQAILAETALGLLGV
jgi:hypothetical protein